MDRGVDRALDSETAAKATERFLDNETTKRVWDKVLESDEAQKLVERVADAPEVRAAIYTGIDCTAAVAVATAWDRSGKTCNTVDNHESPIGPQRTCSVEGFSCLAKRDFYSDARFVTCTQGDQSIRFTWLPA